MPKTFQNVGDYDIVLPSYGADPSGLASYHTIAPSIIIPALPPNFDTLKDLVRVGLCSTELQFDRCVKRSYWMNDASTRCMINILLIEEGADAIPPDVRFEIRQSTSCIPTVRFQGIWSPSANGDNWNANGLLVQLGGMLSTSWEIRAAVIPTVATPVPHEFRIVFEFIFDRIGDNIQALKGPLTTGVMLPPFP